MSVRALLENDLITINTVGFERVQVSDGWLSGVEAYDIKINLKKNHLPDNHFKNVSSI